MSLEDQCFKCVFYITLQAPLDSSAWPDYPNESSDPFSVFSCLFRNLSSVNDKTRQQMRDTPGLVDSLVSYIKTCLEDGKTEDKVKTRRPERELKLLQPRVLLWVLICLLFLCAGGGKRRVHHEEPLVPAVQRDPSVDGASPGRTNQRPGHRKRRRHWLLHCEQQEAQICTNSDRRINGLPVFLTVVSLIESL